MQIILKWENERIQQTIFLLQANIILTLNHESYFKIKLSQMRAVSENTYVLYLLYIVIYMYICTLRYILYYNINTVVYILHNIIVSENITLLKTLEIISNSYFVPVRRLITVTQGVVIVQDEGFLVFHYVYMESTMNMVRSRHRLGINLE